MFDKPKPPEIVIPEAVVVDKPKDTNCPTDIVESPLQAGAMYAALPEPDTLTSAFAAGAFAPPAGTSAPVPADGSLTPGGDGSYVSPTMAGCNGTPGPVGSTRYFAGGGGGGHGGGRRAPMHPRAGNLRNGQ